MAKYFLYPFAQSGDKTAVPDPTQAGGEVSYQEGFGEDYEKELGVDADAKPMPRDETNQLFFDITENLKQWQEDGIPDYQADISSGAGYNLYSRVRYDDGGGVKIYESKTAANTSTPDTVADWDVISGNAGGVVTGAIMPYGGVTAPADYLLCDGSAVSRTTYSDLLAVVSFATNGTLTSGSPIVTGIADTTNMYVGQAVEGSGVPAGAVILTVDSGTQITLDMNASSTGAESLTFFVFGSGDGSTTFNVPDLRRSVPVGAGGTGTATLDDAPGASGGEETHTLTEAEMPGHVHTSTATTFQADSTIIGGHTVFGYGVAGSPGGGGGSASTTIGSTGGDGAHNNIQPSLVMNYIIKT